MSDATLAPAAAAAAPPTIGDDAVEFVIGGHPFRVPIPTLWHADQSGKLLPPGLVANAKQAIDLVLAGSDEAAHLTQELLMQSCTLGEAIKLADSLRELMTRAGVPMVPAPPAPQPAPAIEAQPDRSPNFPAPAA